MINHPILLKELGVDQFWLSKQKLTVNDVIASESEQDTAVPLNTHIAVSDVHHDAGIPSIDVAAFQQEAPVAFHETPLQTSSSVANDVSTMDWQQLADEVSHCQLCHLCSERTNTVFGVGDQQANWMFVGEGPGRNEDLQGEPFVGKAGQLLDNMIKAMGVRRGDNVYIANIIKCRPTDQNGKDRRPSQEEVDACLPFLKRQIELVKPSVIIALGHTAAWALLGVDPSNSVGKLRGRIHQYNQTPVIVTYHPSYLLRQPQDKGLVWKDLCLAMQTYAEHS